MIGKLVGKAIGEAISLPWTVAKGTVDAVDEAAETIEKRVEEATEPKEKKSDV